MSDSIFTPNLSTFSTLLAQAADVAQTDQVTEPGFFESGWFAFLLLMFTIFLGGFLARLISGSLRLPEYRARMTMALVPILLGVLLVCTSIRHRIEYK